MRKYPTGRMTAILALAAFLTGMNGTSAWANPEEAAVQETQPAKPAPTEFAHILSCGIEEGSRIAIRGQMEGTWSDPAYYDNYLYLFELQPYQDTLDGRSDYCGWVTKGIPFPLIFP